jgi:kynurenine formamidase
MARAHGHVGVMATIATLVTLADSTASCRARSEPPSLMDAYQTMASKSFVDLTQRFGPQTPVWSGFGQASFRAATDPKTGREYSIATDGFRSTVYTLVGQYGTHIDAPAHFDEHGATLDEIPIREMLLPLVVFDATPLLKGDPNHAWSISDIEAWEKAHGRVAPGSFAALRTDMSKDWRRNPERFKRQPFPAWSLDAVQFLFEQRGVKAIGHESMDTDTTNSMDSETWLLRHNHFQIEVMANLDQVPPTGAIIIVSWPNVEGGFGFPARCIAVLP